MFNSISNLLLTALVTLLPLAATTAHAADTPSPEQVVAEFQKLPFNVMFCTDESWGSDDKVDWDTTKAEVKKIYGKYFSKEFYKLFMWTECIEPDIPPHQTSFSYDIRFGYPTPTGATTVDVENIRTQPAKLKNANKATVKVLFGSDNFVTTYTLVREDGQWKIDDIAPTGDYVEGGDDEPGLGHSESTKADMQNFYRVSEEDYMREQAKKGAAPKP